VNRTLIALITGCTLAMGFGGSALGADIVGTVRDANGNALPGLQLSTSTQDGQRIGSAVTDGRGDYVINNVSSGLYYITIAPPAGSNLPGQSVASYVGGMGLTVNWAVAPGREPIASAMPGINKNDPDPSAIAFADSDKKPPPGCKGKPGPPCGPKKSVKRHDD
jgi:Carboxypeptidase regulatory-like domain